MAIPLGATIPPFCIVNRTSPYGKTFWTCVKSKSDWYFNGTASRTSSFNFAYPPGTILLMDGIELNSIALRHARTDNRLDEEEIVEGRRRRREREIEWVYSMKRLYY